jgi:hypothetical protein
MNKELKDYTEIELKAFKSDFYEQQQLIHQNLSIINQELARRDGENKQKSKKETA